MDPDFVFSIKDNFYNDCIMPNWTLTMCLLSKIILQGLYSAKLDPDFASTVKDYFYNDCIMPN